MTQKNLFLCLFLCLYYTASAQLEVDLEQFATGLSSPIAIEHAGDDRLFIIERAGSIKILDSTGTITGTFLDINSIVHNTGGQSEQGLLGLAFHPDYANNGYFYIHYTAPNDDSIIARYSVSTDPDVADDTSESIIMTVSQPYGNHNGGDLDFGPDGYLYIGFGDGGAANDPGNRAQDPQTFMGKMLRIDVDNVMPYSVPADNPFVGDSTTLDEIWATGLRNPWRFSFDTETGDLWMGDVGQGEWEEIDFQAANSTGGENYGWRCREGDHDFNTSGCAGDTAYVAPVAEYNHLGFTHCSVTGGHVYRGSEFPDMVGHYIFGDYCSGRLWSTSKDANDEWTTEEVGSFPGYDISAFGVDANGEMYLARMGNGRIYKLTSGCPATTISVISLTDGSLSTPDDFDTYQWLLNGNPIDAATAATYIPTTSGDYSVEVTDANGCVYTSTAVMVIVSGVKTLQNVDKIVLSPNPFLDSVLLQIDADGEVDLGVTVVNLQGKELLSQKLKFSNQLSQNIDLSDLTSGIYLINFKTEHGILTKKIVKQ